MIKIKIVLSSVFDFNFDGGHLEQVRKIAPQATIVIDNGLNKAGEWEDADILYGQPSIKKLKMMTNLKWMHLPSAGVEQYCTPEARKYMPEIFTNSSGVYGQPISEYLLACMLMFARDLTHYAHNQYAGQWEKRPYAADFYNSTVGIVGLGDIGTALAQKCHALGAHVIGLKRRPAPKPPFVDELFVGDGMDELLMRSDFVALCLPNTDETRHVITAQRLKLMKPTAVLLNVGRGSAIDQDALVYALENNEIFGAALDVTQPEPLPPDHKLWKLDNVFITPHISGRSPSNQQRSLKIFFDNLKAYITNQPMSNIVDIIRGY